MKRKRCEPNKMHKILSFILVLALCLPALSAAGEVHTRGEIRALYANFAAGAEGAAYLERPRLAPPYGAGALTEGALRTALNYLNFLRRVAYIENDVALLDLYNLRSQHGAALLAANDRLLHDAPIAPGMDWDFYETAHAGTMSSNIASINWMDEGILRTAIEYFVRDDGAGNLAQLGHRRWLLNPNMGKTGFGLANAASGITYAAMYAHDLSGDGGAWDHIAWPSRGAFPAELMSAEIAWSVTLNPHVYDAAGSDIQISMAEQRAGAANLSYFTVNLENYGAGPCAIFVPDLAAMGIEAYEQNQVWRVELTGLRRLDGGEAAISYTIEMMALSAQDPAGVELDRESLTLKVGERARLAASVVPGWADDLSISWASSDEGVAAVDGLGNVSAIAPGVCAITATAVNGRAASCEVTVVLQQ